MCVCMDINVFLSITCIWVWHIFVISLVLVFVSDESMMLKAYVL